MKLTATAAISLYTVFPVGKIPLSPARMLGLLISRYIEIWYCLFVTAGSTYRTLKIINENNQKAAAVIIETDGRQQLSRIKWMDGTAGTQFSNLEIEANDSIYVFVQVNVNPGAQKSSFIIRDSIQLSYNGKTRQVQLEAWGQNAHFFRDKSKRKRDLE